MAGQEVKCDEHDARLRQIELETASSVARLAQSVNGINSHVEAIGRSLEGWTDKFGKMQSLESNIKSLCDGVKQLTGVLESERKERSRLIAALDTDMGELRRGLDKMEIRVEAYEAAAEKEFRRLTIDLNNIGKQLRDSWLQHKVDCESKWKTHDVRADGDHATWAQRGWGLLEKIIVFVVIGGLGWALATYRTQPLYSHEIQEMDKAISGVQESVKSIEGLIRANHGEE